MLDNFFTYINSKKINKNTKIIVAVSGGIDSMVLCKLLESVGVKMIVCHINHQLRGQDADLDEAFVVHYCATNHIPCITEKIPKDAWSTGNIQSKARAIRYDILFKCLKIHHADYIATAHHLDDSMETFLLNALRGTGLAGLSGIRDYNSIIRPLHSVHKDDIRQFALDNNITYREDISNTSTKYTRNSIRLRVIPLLEDIDVRFKKSFASTVDNLQSAHALLEYFIAKNIHNYVFTERNILKINLKELKGIPGYTYILHKLLSSYGLSTHKIKELAHKNNNGQKYLSPDYFFYIHNHHIEIWPIKYIHQDSNTYTLMINATPCSFTFSRFHIECRYTATKDTQHSPDYTIRHIQPSDIFKIKHRSKPKKISVHLKELGWSAYEIMHTPVVLVNGVPQGILFPGWETPDLPTWHFVISDFLDGGVPMYYL